MDSISIERAKKAHPAFRGILLEVLKEADQALTGDYTLRYSSVFRSDKEQDEIYAQGRTRKGPIVTTVKGGFSLHNYGLAVDIVLLKRDGKEVSWERNKDFDGDGIADFMEVAKIFKSKGISWGGDWNNFKDYPHFQYETGFSMNELRRRRNNKLVDAEGYVKLSV